MLFSSRDGTVIDANALLIYLGRMIEGATRIFARRFGAIGDPETTIEARESPNRNDNNLDGIVEDVVASFAVKPRRIVGRTRLKSNTGAEPSAESKKHGGKQDEEDLVAHRAGTKVISDTMTSGEESESEDGNRQKGQNGKIGDGKELYVADFVQGAHVESVEAVDDGNDDHDEQGDDAEQEEAKDETAGSAPAKVRVVGADDSLGENQVDDEEQDDAGVGKDVGGNGDAGVARVPGPDDAHDVCQDTGHAEAKRDGADDEFVASLAVDLEYRHVEDCRGDE